MLVVDKDCVRMSDFVKEKTGVFEKGQVFYEFTQEEDLPYCRKIINLTEAQVNFIYHCPSCNIIDQSTTY